MQEARGSRSEAGIVDVRVAFDDPHIAGRGSGDSSPHGFEERGVGLLVPEGAGLGVDPAHAPQRQHERDRAAGAESLLPYPPAEFGVLLRSGPHERDHGIVDDEGPSLESLRHILARPEVDHVEGSEGDDLGNPRGAGSGQAIRARGEDPADELVGELGGRQVEDSREPAVGGELLQRPSSGAGGVEDQGLVPEAVEDFARLVDGRRRQPEHRQRDDRLGLPAALRPPPLVLLGHAGRCGRGVAEDLAGHAVDSRHVHHRVHHRDVGLPDVGRDVAAGHGRDEEFREADGKCPHRPGGHGRPARAAGGQNRVDVPAASPGRDDRRGATRHDVHGRAPIGAPAQVRDVLACSPSHVGGGHVGLGVGQRADVDRQDRGSPRPNARGEVLAFHALRVESSNQSDCCHVFLLHTG